MQKRHQFHFISEHANGYQVRVWVSEEGIPESGRENEWSGEPRRIGKGERAERALRVGEPRRIGKVEEPRRIGRVEEPRRIGRVEGAFHVGKGRHSLQAALQERNSILYLAPHFTVRSISLRQEGFFDHQARSNTGYDRITIASCGKSNGRKYLCVSLKVRSLLTGRWSQIAFSFGAEKGGRTYEEALARALECRRLHADIHNVIVDHYNELAKAAMLALAEREKETLEPEIWRAYGFCRGRWEKALEGLDRSLLKEFERTKESERMLECYGELREQLGLVSVACEKG
ncbi:hypothetical protein [Ectothiorhodospira shaposhnikovii]|uniref:hypothetical protein n=1 Tax=Ectothiorhodospira shaposhnikovii TaxID=1054 RepID=UPI001EE82754|nr:hypothetical protein [Ectothiorhodospira shaposhnikovii]MCG5512814.1 hypothetical protein [Ectothiorhodospira shaposhnikovii]